MTGRQQSTHPRRHEQPFHPCSAACCRTRSLCLMCASKRATAPDSCSVQYVPGTVRGGRVHEGRVMSDQGRPQEFLTPPGGRGQTAPVSKPIHGEADPTRTRTHARTHAHGIKVFQSHAKLMFLSQTCSPLKKSSETKT